MTRAFPAPGRGLKRPPAKALASRFGKHGADGALYCGISWPTFFTGSMARAQGHSTRAQEVISHLIARGHSVHVASFDRGLRNLREKFEVTEIYGLRLAYVNNQVRYGRTLTRNLLSVRQRAKSIALLSERVEEWKIQLVITDFEPLTSHVGHHLRLPVISIDNQHCLTNTDVTYPRKYRRDAAVAKLVTRIMTPRADAYLVTSFFEARVKRPRTFLFPPILRQQVLQARADDRRACSGVRDVSGAGAGEALGLGALPVCGLRLRA